MTDVIKEFLVSLGFKTDTVGLQSFNGAISGATSTIDGMVKALDDMTKKYESLHYASQRTGATVQSLQAVEYASKRVGMSAGEGAAAMESFAEAMRKNPSVEDGLVARYGKIQTDKAKEFNSFIEGVKRELGDTKQGYAIAHQIAEIAGIPEHTFFQIWKNTEKYKKSFEEFKEIYNEGGFNADAFDKKSVQFQDSLERLGVRLDSMKMRFYSGLIDPAQKTVDILDKLAKAVNIQVGKSGEEGGLVNGIASLLPDKAAQSFKKGAAEAEKSWKKSEDEYRKGGGNRFLGWWMGWSDEHKEPMKPNISVLPHGMPRRQSMAPDSGIPVSDRAIISMIESGGRANARTGRYKGKNMLSDEEFEKYGGGDIYNAADNDRAAAAALEAHKAAFRRRHDRNPSLTELYMMHQQGEGGAEAHMAHPERPAWMNMYSTAEGRRKGPDWARKAIWGNVPDDMKSRYGGAASITSQQFMDLWHEKIDRFSARIGGGSRGWSARTEPTDEQSQADTFARGAKAEAPDITQHNNFTVHINGVTEPDKVRDAMRDGARDWSRISTDWLAKAGDTMR